MPCRSHILMVLSVMGAMLCADIGSKWAIQNLVMQPPRVIPILPVFNLTLGFNTGVSFGIGRDFFDAYPLVLALFKLCITAGLLVWAVLASLQIERIGLALISGEHLAMLSIAGARAQSQTSSIFIGQAGIGQHSISPTSASLLGLDC